MTSPRISFIVPVRNDAARLETCLRSILGNGHAPGQIEIIVVDNGSTDRSAEAAATLGARVITIGHGRVSELRNRGAAQARADVLAFVDADHEIVAGWVDSALACLQLPRVGVAGALCHPPADGTWVQRTYGHLRGGARGQHDTDWLGSGNLVVRRDVFESAGGFDTSLETCEDVDFCHRVRARGLRVVSDARLRNVHHGDPATLREVFSSERWRGRDNLRVSFRRPLSWASLPSAIVPIVDTILIAVAIGGVVMSVRAGWFGLLVSGAALGGFAAAACLRAVRATLRDGRRGPVGLLQTFVVACALDGGRALALDSRAPHRAARPRPVEAAS
jgi:glycosyltransferase involved in cell wall biosynthesis